MLFLSYRGVFPLKKKVLQFTRKGQRLQDGFTLLIKIAYLGPRIPPRRPLQPPKNSDVRDDLGARMRAINRKCSSSKLDPIIIPAKTYTSNHKTPQDVTKNRQAIPKFYTNLQQA